MRTDWVTGQQFTPADVNELTAAVQGKLDTQAVKTAVVTVGAVRFKEDANALGIYEVAGTNGRRLSIQPHDQGTSTASTQLELIPGANVDPTQITSQILLYNRTGANHERLVTSAYNNEFQIHVGAIGAGVVRPLYFYSNDVKALGLMPDASLRVYSELQFGDSDVRMEKVAASTLALNSQLRVGVGTAGEVRIGNTASLGRPTINFAGPNGPLWISQNGTVLEVAGGLRASAGFGANGAAAAGKQTLSAAATDAATTQTLVNQIRAALVTFGLTQ